MFEVTWQVLSGPTALVTVQDKVCIDCVDEMLLEASDTAGITTFLETTSIKDPLE